MPTELKNVNTDQDAVTIFMDDLDEESSSIGDLLKIFFEDGEYIYRRQDPVGGQELFECLRNGIKEGEITPTSNNRMIICYQMMLESLTNEWIDAFFNKADDLRRFSPVTSMFEHHYMLFLRYEAGHIVNEEEKQRLNQLMIRFGTERKDISHQMYLMRIAGLSGDFSSQEKALVTLLHLLSRRDYRIVQQVKYFDSLRILDSEDYYAARAADCKAQIEAIDKWQDGATDPELAELVQQIRIPIQAASETIQKADREFRRRARIYPVNINTFEGNIFKGYHSTVSPNHPVMREIRGEYIRDLQNSLLEQADFSELGKIIGENYHYPDYKELQNRMADGRLLRAVEANFANQQTEDTAELVISMQQKAEDVVRSLLPDVEALKSEKLRQRRMYNKELNKAGKYHSLEECFSRINEETNPKPIAGEYPVNTYATALVSGEPAGNWTIRQYSIAGIMTAYRYPSISPCEVLVLKESELVDLGKEDAEKKLNIIY